MAILCTMGCMLEAQEKYELSASFQGLSFQDFVKQAESSYPVRFYYKEEWVSDLKVGDYPDCTTLSCLLDHLLMGTTLYYFIEETGNILITNNFALKTTLISSDEEKNFISPTGNNASAEKQQNTSGTTIEIGNPAEKNRHGNTVISGYITNTESKEPVPGVTVFIQKLATGTMSNEFGYYTLSIPRGNHLLQFSSIGMKEKAIQVNLNDAGELNVEMNTAVIPLKEVVVTAEKSLTLQRFEVGAEKINVSNFKLLPTSLGEADILKSVLLIPGVQSVGEGSTGFNVRGGSADQNLILLYGAPVYNSNHLFGFFSAVNSDIIRDVTLYKGGIPSQYGGRISSVLDIGAKEGNRNEFKGTAGISPITTHVMVEGPVIKNALTYLFAARTTYSNWIFDVVHNPALKNSKANFYDLNGKLTYDLNKNNKIDLSGYYSHDAFRFNSDTLYLYDNSIVALKWRHFFSSQFFSAFSVNNSTYNYNVSSQAIPVEAFEHIHKVRSTGFKADFQWFPGRNEVNFGLDLTRYLVHPGNYLPGGDSSLVIPQYIEKEQAWEGALYIDDRFMLTKFLSVNVGLRLSSFLALGPQSVMLYESGYSKSKTTVNDTLNFKPGQVISKYAGPEFRLSLNFRINESNSFKINYNRTRQYVHLLSNSTSISPTDTWKLCDYYLRPQIGDQVAAGFYKVLFNNRFEVSAEVYYKVIRNMVDYKGGTNLIMNDNIEKDVIDVKGKAYGMELVLKKTSGRIRYSMGYTYSRTFLKSQGTFDEEIINAGEWFPANFDKPHDLIIALNYLISRRFSITSDYVYSTGRPITFPVSTYTMYDNMLVHYSDRNKYRIPDYSRWDISFKISGNLRSHKIAHPSWTFSVYNLLGRQNVYSIYFKKEEDLMKGYKLSVFGQAIPTVTFSFDF